MQIVATKDEREILSRLVDDLAAKHAPLYKNAHIILKSALNASKPAHELIREQREEWLDRDERGEP